MSSIGISLGWSCTPAVLAVKKGLRLKKAEGYKTCPFDMVISNYPGILECIRTDFKDFCDPQYLTLHHGCIYHTKYNFCFNHESPDHANLFEIQKWEGGTNHFVSNNFANFIKRYQNRISNFRNYLSDPANIISFVIFRYNSVPTELENLLIEKYPSLKFKIICMINSDKDRELSFLSSLMQFSPDSPELARFTQPPCIRIEGKYTYLD
jgi:hypothetical protein